MSAGPTSPGVGARPSSMLLMAASLGIPRLARMWIYATMVL